MERKTYKLKDLKVGQLVQWNKAYYSSIGKVIEIVNGPKGLKSAIIEWNQFRENTSGKFQEEEKSKTRLFYEVTQQSIEVTQDETTNMMLNENLHVLTQQLYNHLNFDEISRQERLDFVNDIQKKMNELLDSYKNKIAKNMSL